MDEEAPEKPPPGTRQVAIQKVQLMTPDGPLRGQVQVDTGPMRLADLVDTANELTNVMSARADQRSEKLGLKISCAKGCGACCRQMVPVSIPEAYYLADLLERMDALERARATGRFEAIVAHLDKLNMADNLLDAKLASDAGTSLSRTYFALQMACPFLVDESCSIHTERPTGCRSYTVTSPAAWCRDPWTFPVKPVPMPMPLSLALARTATDVTGHEPMLIPLTLVPRWVSEHPEWRSATWPGLELFQKFMDHAAGRGPGEADAPGEAPPNGPTPNSTPAAGPDQPSGNPRSSDSSLS